MTLMLTDAAIDALLEVPTMRDDRYQHDRYEVEVTQTDNDRTMLTRWDSLEEALAHARRHRAVGLRAVQYFKVTIRDRSKDQPEQVVWRAGPDADGQWVETANLGEGVG